MREIIDYNLEVKVITYDTEEERDAHVLYMKNIGWRVKRCDLYMLSAESTIKAYNNDDNWYYYAEYYRENQINIDDKNKCYSSDIYYFGFYNEKES